MELFEKYNLVPVCTHIFLGIIMKLSKQRYSCFQHNYHISITGALLTSNLFPIPFLLQQNTPSNKDDRYLDTHW